MMTSHSVHSDLAIPPGEYLEEVIAELSMTKNELASRMNRPAAKISAIFSGKKSITADTALQLEKVVGVPAHIWTGLEAEYRLALARRQHAQEKKHLEKEQRLVTMFCYNELVKSGFLERKTKPSDKVSELHRFFGVTSLYSIPNLRRYKAAFRVGQNHNKKISPEAMAAWLRIGEVKAQKSYCAPFNKQALIKALPVIRSLTRKTPEGFESRLIDVLAEYGVSLVLAPHFPKTYAHGAVFWLGKDKAALMLTIRGSWADIFWFSLFHEIGHILLHDRKTVFIDGELTDHLSDQKEREADRFAANTIISSDKYKQFIKQGSYLENDIRYFAEEIDVHPGIVVGRLQHDGYIDKSWHNRLRIRFTWDIEQNTNLKKK